MKHRRGTKSKKTDLQAPFQFGIWLTVLVLSAMAVGLIFSAPILARGNPAQRETAGWIVLGFSPLCHQIPQRSFALSGLPLAVCARCTGLFVGFFFGIVLYPILRAFRISFLWPRPRNLVLAALPMAAEVGLTTLFGWPFDPIIRSCTGFVLGTMAAWFVLFPLFSLNYKLSYKSSAAGSLNKKSLYKSSVAGPLNSKYDTNPV